jgi:Uma2 family endonuclease
MTIPPPRIQPATVADLLRRLGNIPPERILLQPPPGTATEADVIAAANQPHKRLCELIAGTLVERGMGTRESLLGGILFYLIRTFVRQNNLGLVLPGDAMFRIAPSTVRGPDVSFISWDRLPGGELPDEAISSVVPDFTVEILSPSNTQAEIDQKIREYFAAGVRLVWVIDPNTQSGEILTAPGASRPIPTGGTLTGETVLPGLVIALPELFAETRRPSP